MTSIKTGTRGRVWLFLVIALWLACTLLSSSAFGGAVSPHEESEARSDEDAEGSRKTTRGRIPTLLFEKLDLLIRHFKLTSAEIAIATGSSLRTVEERRKKLKGRRKDRDTPNAKFDQSIDCIYSIASMLDKRYSIEPANARAWLIGRSAYLEEQRPADLLREGEFDLVREAAIAYATGETPAEFLEGRDSLPRATSAVRV